MVRKRRFPVLVAITVSALMLTGLTPDTAAEAIAGARRPSRCGRCAAARAASKSPA